MPPSGEILNYKFDLPITFDEVDIEGGSLVFHTLVFEIKVERLGAPDELLAESNSEAVKFLKSSELDLQCCVIEITRQYISNASTGLL